MIMLMMARNTRLVVSNEGESILHTIQSVSQLCVEIGFTVLETKFLRNRLLYNGLSLMTCVDLLRNFSFMLYLCYKPF